MQTQDSSVLANKNFMSRLSALVTNAKTVNKLNVHRSKRHGIEDARQSVADKLRKAAAYVRDPSSEELGDSPIKQQDDKVYSLGIKYCNRWLHGVFGGDTYVVNLNAEEVCLLADEAAQAALAGELDDYIKPIMAENLAAAAKRR